MSNKNEMGFINLESCSEDVMFLLQVKQDKIQRLEKEIKELQFKVVFLMDKLCKHELGASLPAFGDAEGAE